MLTLLQNHCNNLGTMGSSQDLDNHDDDDCEHCLVSQKSNNIQSLLRKISYTGPGLSSPIDRFPVLLWM